MRFLVWLLPFLLLASCSYEETSREVGHKGKARINPYLAAERLLAEFDFEVEQRSGWPDFSGDVSMALLPVSSLSAKGYVDDLDQWARYGGHAVLLLNHGESFIGDWNVSTTSWRQDVDEYPEVFTQWMSDRGIEFDNEPGEDGDPFQAEEVGFLGKSYEVFMEAGVCPIGDDGQPTMIRTIGYGDGRITVMADARPFRNRWIGDYDHADLLLAFEDASPYFGSTAFVRNVSLSFFGLLWSQAWPAVVALVLLILFWLWRSLPRSGPLDSHESNSGARAYDHHLEALGDFHWRLDRAEGLLRPLRDALLERAHRLTSSSAAEQTDVFALIADRAGISRERAERAMTFERSKDAATFTRLVADLQTIHLSIP